MKRGRVLLLVLFTWLIASAAQARQATAPLVAFTNSSGQLIVSSGDGSSRWIVTNPGETLTGDPVWSGSRLLFGIAQADSSSLRSADPASQTVSEIGQVSGSARSISPDGKFVFYQQPDGSYGVAAVGGSLTTLPLSNDLGARSSGLWADSAPLVAYWGYAGNSVLGVTNAATGRSVTLDSGRAAPITPLAWLPNTSILVFRDTSASFRSADVACLINGECSPNPLESAIALASADAAVTDGTWLYFRSGEQIDAVNLSCIAAQNCLNSAVTLAGNAAPQTAPQVGGNTLLYTAYQQNPNDPNDREVRALDLSCLSSPSSCAPQPILEQAVAGAVSSEGRFAVVQVNGGLQSLDLSSGKQTYLADQGADLDGAIWQP